MQTVRFLTNRAFWQLRLATGMSREFELRANCLASLEVLSCSAPIGMTLQLLCMLHTYATFGNSPVARSSREALQLFFTHSHTLPLHDSHLNTGFLNAKLQANLAQNKANKMIE